MRVWKLSDSSHRVFSGHKASVNNVDFDPAGTLLLTASDDTTARVWDVATGGSKLLIGHTDKVLSSSFSPSGLHAVTAGMDHSARVWSVATGKVLVVLSGHAEQITYVTYSKDGKYVLTASNDATARVWAAPASGNFEIEQPIISAIPPNHSGDCPVTISFFAKITVLSGSGTVVYRFKDSDQRVWQSRELTFDEPATKYVHWYWRITGDYTGYETIEILEPQGIKEQRARFTVKCGVSASPKPESTITPEPTPSPSPAPS